MEINKLKTAQEANEHVEQVAKKQPTMTYKDRIGLERRRLRELNPNIQPFGYGWLKLSATARVNICRRDGVYNEVAEKVLQSHCVGSEAAIEIVGTEPAPWAQQEKQLTLF